MQYISEIILDKIKEIVAKLTQNPIEEIKEDSTKENISGWDSLAHLNIIMEIEKTFEITLSMEEAVSIDSIRDIAEIIERKKGEN